MGAVMEGTGRRGRTVMAVFTVRFEAALYNDPGRGGQGYQAAD